MCNGGVFYYAAPRQGHTHTHTMLPRDTHSDEEIDDESQISALPLLARSIPRSERASKGPPPRSAVCPL